MPFQGSGFWLGFTYRVWGFRIKHFGTYIGDLGLGCIIRGSVSCEKLRDYSRVVRIQNKGLGVCPRVSKRLMLKLYFFGSGFGSGAKPQREQSKTPSKKIRK